MNREGDVGAVGEAIEGERETVAGGGAWERGGGSGERVAAEGVFREIGERVAVGIGVRGGVGERFWGAPESLTP